MSVSDFTVKRAQKGDKGAIDALLRAHYNTVHAVCHRIVINSADADDATQMALIAIVRALPRFDRRSSVSTWIYRIATNAALDELRRIKRRPVPVDDTVLENTTLESTSTIDDQMLITSALRQIPEEYRVVLVLRHIADLDYEEIAAIVEVPVGTVRSRLARGRAQLTEIVGNQLVEPHRQTSDSQIINHKEDLR
ncbi:MAG: hypothetical protein RIR69_849 [Actinomycetota bacterium]